MSARRFHSGWNVENALWIDEPSCHERWTDAAAWLIELMQEYADNDDAQAIEAVDWDQVGPEREQEWFSSEEAPAMLATVGAILRDDPPVEPNDFRATIEDHEYRRIAFWLTKVQCDVPAHEEQS